MKFTCLSEGRGIHFPSCHLLSICGFRVLFDCPVDLSALTMFSPAPTGSYMNNDATACPSLNTLDLLCGDQKRRRLEKTLDAHSLIHAEPYYRTVEKLHLWDASLIDIILISSPVGMLGLPFLTRANGFNAKIYATEVTARIGQLMMEDLVSMHAEFRQFYGPEEFGFPQWMNWKELEALPVTLKNIALGEDGSKLGGLLPLYSAADVKQCLEKVHAVKYAEEVCYNGTLLMKAFSSGLEIGSCNWTLKGPKGNIAYLSASVSASAVAMDFDFNALKGSDMIIFSDFSSRNALDDAEDDSTVSSSVMNDFPTISSDRGDTCEVSAAILLSTDEKTEEMNKLDFICSCSVDSVKAGGSVLIPVGRLGIILQLLEHMSLSLRSSRLKIPIFIISSVAEELLTFSNIIPEWLCKQRQEKLFAGESVFAHAELIEEKRLHLFPAVHSVELLEIWQEPCIVFCPHWSLRLGPAVSLLERWCRNQNSLLVIEEGLDADLALLPFKPMAMKVLQCSFISGLRLEKVQPLLKILQPKLVLLPKYLRQHVASLSKSMSCIHYNEGETLRIPKLKDFTELSFELEIDWQLSGRRLKQKLDGARLMGELSMEDGMHFLRPGNGQTGSSMSRSLLHWGKLDLENLLTALQKKEIKGSVERAMNEDGLENASRLHILKPNKALIEVKGTSTVISTADENLASLISEAICTILNGI